jgi:uncharacterized protein YcgL (UPF0745 family)
MMEKRVPLTRKIQSYLFVNNRDSILSKVTKKLFTVYNRFQNPILLLQNPLQLQKYQ